MRTAFTGIACLLRRRRWAVTAGSSLETIDPFYHSANPTHTLASFFDNMFTFGCGFAHVDSQQKLTLHFHLETPV